MAPTRPDAGEAKSLTPQRKHRKLLKDGSGSEVWPEAIEKIFVEGLKQYWQSPWATYSRGRSRWRNQFLVDYLGKVGIIRTKKQVASHIQVLRNMWKGEREYHLVAGGEELFQESGLLGNVKLEERFDTRSLMQLEAEDSDGVSSSNTSPNCSPPEFKSDLNASPMSALVTNFPYDTSPASAKHSPLDGFNSYPTSPSSPLASFSFSNDAYVSPPPHWDYNSSSSSIYSSNNSPQAPAQIYPSSASTAAFPTATIPHGNSPSNRLIGFYLLADGMQPLSVKTDTYIPQSQGHSWPVAIQTKLFIPPIDDTRSAHSLHGFIGSVSLTANWATSASCVTKAYDGKICISQEAGNLQPSPTNGPGQPTQAFLPDSPLARCRWMPTASVITQQIIVDGHTLLYIIHSIDQKVGGAMPTAELTSCQPYRSDATSGTQAPQQPQQPQPHPQVGATVTPSASYAAASTYSYPQQPQQQPASVYAAAMHPQQQQQQQYTSYPRRPTQTSLSYALSPTPPPPARSYIY
ncbi:hypothetical protein HGRIS_013097 [Hohenbuehelia grisea]|uniref:TEA domain-containing protein n=1 Tax=Hohenbuehelia grisea TaxID=104357 RepID=A0ABR3IUD1_9AGAR